MAEHTKCENTVTLPVCSAFWLLGSCAVSLRNQLSRGGVCTHPSRRWLIGQWQLEGQLGKVRRSSQLERECVKPGVSSENKSGVKVNLWGEKMALFLFFSPFPPGSGLSYPLNKAQSTVSQLNQPCYLVHWHVPDIGFTFLTCLTVFKVTSFYIIWSGCIIQTLKMHKVSESNDLIKVHFLD